MGRYDALGLFVISFAIAGQIGCGIWEYAGTRQQKLQPSDQDFV
jgi:hypothetical protein